VSAVRIISPHEARRRVPAIAGRPPNWSQIVAVMGEPDQSFCITYAPFVYSLSGAELTPDLEVHEHVHLRQQGKRPDVWWTRWLMDIRFRRDQELEAYRAQMIALRQMYPDRNALMRIRVQIAGDLAGRPYGACMPFAEALAALR
jgi:hypothetical protein